MTVSPVAGQYFLEIESHFATRRGTPFILSAKDWALMKQWFDGGIPLSMVIEAIDSVFEKNESSGRRKVISSLSYCRHAVKEIWQERQDLYAGSGEAPPEANAGALLEALAADVERSAASPEVIARIAEDIRALAVRKSTPEIEQSLIEIERLLMERLLQSMSSQERQRIVQPLTAIVADLDEQTRVRTYEATLRRGLRERFALPRLTLFR